MVRGSLIGALLLALWGAAVSDATAGVKDMTPFGRVAYARAQQYSWHGSYYDAAWGTPVALVVPPTAGMHTEYSWGVGGTRILPIHHQFGRAFPGYGYGAAFAPTPQWPSDTAQFGIYYVRGPW